MKLNTLFCLVLIVAGFIVPGVAFGSGIIPPNGFGAIFIKVISAIALITLLTNVVSVLAYKDRR